MTYVLDTSVVIRLRDGDPLVGGLISPLEGPFVLSVVTRIELENGVYRMPADIPQRRARLDRMLENLATQDFTPEDVQSYRRIVELAGYSRRKLLDRMIAAQALTRRATLITFNGTDFRDVPGLSLLQW